ncbi:hypothetical protein BDQ17DRAFT_1441682 [Cyathus striatus]|nr:hypothetical protein BDQ17DRAFT_1441682 [Cyathus striatus]
MHANVLTTQATEDIINLIRNAEWHGYLEAASQTALIWDYCLTLDSEVRFIWHWPKSWITLLFVANRYLAIVAQVVSTIGHVSINLSYEIQQLPMITTILLNLQLQILNSLLAHNYQYVPPPSSFLLPTNAHQGILQLMVTDGIVWLCVSALYGNQKRVKYPLLALFILSMLSSIVIVAFMGMKSRGTSNLAPELHRCVLTSTPYKLLWTFWIPIMIYEITTLVLVARKLYLYATKKYEWTSELLETILKDTALYLVVILAMFIGDAVLFANPDPSLAGVLVPISLVTLSVLGNRMLFNLRAQSAAHLISENGAIGESTTRRVEEGEELRFGRTEGTVGTVY